MDLEELSAYLGNTSEAFDHLNSAILIVYRERDLYTGKAGKHIEKQTKFFCKEQTTPALQLSENLSSRFGEVWVIQTEGFFLDIFSIGHVICLTYFNQIWPISGDFSKKKASSNLLGRKPCTRNKW